MAARVSVIKFGDNGYVFTGIGKNNNALAKHDQQLIAAAHSFRKLSTQQRSQIKPQRIRVVQLKGNIGWPSLAKISPLETLHQKISLGSLTLMVTKALSLPHRRVKVIE